jgi:hypothetical protein
MDRGAFFALQREAIEERLRLTFSRGPGVKKRLAELNQILNQIDVIEYPGAACDVRPRTADGATGEGD